MGFFGGSALHFVGFLHGTMPGAGGRLVRSFIELFGGLGPALIGRESSWTRCLRSRRLGIWSSFPYFPFGMMASLWLRLRLGRYGAAGLFAWHFPWCRNMSMRFEHYCGSVRSHESGFGLLDRHLGNIVVEDVRSGHVSFAWYQAWVVSLLMSPISFGSG